MVAVMNLSNNALEYQMGDLVKSGPLADYNAPYPLLVSLQVFNDTGMASLWLGGV